MPKALTDRDFADALVAAGILTAEQLHGTMRIVIVAEAGKLVTMHIQRRGDTRLLDVAQLLASGEIVYAPAQPIEIIELEPKSAGRNRS